MGRERQRQDEAGRIYLMSGRSRAANLCYSTAARSIDAVKRRNDGPPSPAGAPESFKTSNPQGDGLWQTSIN